MSDWTPLTAEELAKIEDAYCEATGPRPPAIGKLISTVRYLYAENARLREWLSADTGITDEEISEGLAEREGT